MGEFVRWFFNLFKKKRKGDVIKLPVVKSPPKEVGSPPYEVLAIPLPPPKPQAAVITAAAVAVAVAASVLMSGGHDRIYGVTLTNPWGNNLTQSIEAMKKMKHRPTARIVYDEKGMPLKDFLNAAKKVAPVADVMAEVLDSFFMKNLSIEQYAARAKSVSVDPIKYVEICNECNGEWLGADAGKKAYAAWKESEAAGKISVLTLYLDCPFSSCASDKFRMIPWAKANIPDDMKQGIDMVLISYYKQDQQNWQPNWADVLANGPDSIASLFPNSKFGIGEMGSKNAAQDEEQSRECYALRINHPRFALGCFNWYADTGGWERLKKIVADIF